MNTSNKRESDLSFSKYLDKIVSQEGSMWNTDFHKIVEENRQMKAKKEQNNEAGHETPKPKLSDEDKAFYRNWMLT